MQKCCLCGKSFLGKGLEMEGFLMPEVCSRLCLERELKEASGQSETKDSQRSSNEEAVPLQDPTLAFMPA